MQKRKNRRGRKIAAGRSGSIFGLGGPGPVELSTEPAARRGKSGDKSGDKFGRSGKGRKKERPPVQPDQLLAAEVSMHARGFGFAVLDDPAAAAKFKKDIFLPPGEALGGAIHGDKVLVQVVKQSRDRAEGRVVEIVSRGITRVVGFYVAGKSTGLVEPEDERLPYRIVVKRARSLGARNGEAVYAEIEKFRGEGNPEGRVLEVLGNPADARVQTTMAVRAFELPHQFTEEVLAEAENLKAGVRLTKDRQDLRDIPHVTIDGEDARDFDDAVAVEPLADDGYRLYVSIADVSHYVRPGSQLDQEAYARGTSVYFPGRVLPMLPERLSNNLCSLMPGVDRCTFTAIIDFDGQGHRRKARFCRSLIKSRHRLTYNQVRAMLEDREPELCRRYQDVLADLEQLQKLAVRLNRVRMARGSIGFEIPEADIRVDDEGQVEVIRRSERNLAHKLVEECMLAANEAVAEFLERKGAEVLYRIHEDPDPVKVAEFAEFARAMGLDIPDNPGGPAWFGKVLQLAAGTPREYIVSNLLLRSMQQARYAPKNVGHFGLAATHYTHFTSPIRRYPDLMVHRALAKLLGVASRPRGKKADLGPSGGLAPGHGVDEAGIWLSRRERLAVDAEREVNDRLAALYMVDRVGEEFEAVVSGVGGFGLFVELVEIMLSGAVAVTEMRDDYYEVEEKSHRLIGRRHAKTYQIGDLVRVRLVEVDQRRRRLNFTLVPVA
ncbi:ribonuclease R [Desulfurivibrio alkaliphilus]|uniref:Ribonuclease R n=1 Tax=Desulfurivibrio alkaliphilus (strain DSM 19089 / UNIQEM U267 / AHT2) TaxID=589865 RepID=D6Z109_DESAT|nr:ribonuclease R [Desulfurivibrio alkaliphilus]ADH87269.1 ribonuclease R [Desulfurivibrio alkaliphilus AHT 2]